MQPVYIAPPAPGSESTPADAAVPASLGTEADRLRSQYQALGEEQKHTYGDNPPGTKPMDFTKLGNPGTAAQQAPAPVKNPASPAGAPPGSGAVGPAPSAGRPAVPPAVAPTNPDAKKNPPALPGVPAAPPAAAPSKSGTGVQSPPAKNPPPPTGAPAKNPPDAARRLNQSGGVPPGGQPR
jgi:hypothetical protein